MQAGVRAVDGIELSQDMVDRMREKPGGDQVGVTMGDMSRVTTGRTYGLAYLVFNTIGNLLTQEDQVRCFQNAAGHLTDDGVFVLECRIPTAPSRPGHQYLDTEQVGLDHVDPRCRAVRPADPSARPEPHPHQQRGHQALPHQAPPGPPTRVRPHGPHRRPPATRTVGRVERRAVHRAKLAPHQRLRTHRQHCVTSAQPDTAPPRPQQPAPSAEAKEQRAPVVHDHVGAGCGVIERP
ncbi:hypothetical protein QOM21_01515 [Streptomyces sp. Pv4-95]|uniref:hypothetical protein n=1 Tax=Streptomyces sp. Pv4-95 TaxID=3049543 RepID=UPI0038925BCE